MPYYESEDKVCQMEKIFGSIQYNIGKAIISQKFNNIRLTVATAFRQLCPIINNPLLDNGVSPRPLGKKCPKAVAIVNHI